MASNSVQNVMNYVVPNQNCVLFISKFLAKLQSQNFCKVLGILTPIVRYRVELVDDSTNPPLRNQDLGYTLFPTVSGDNQWSLYRSLNRDNFKSPSVLMFASHVQCSCYTSRISLVGIQKSLS